MYVILECHLKCNFGLMANYIISFYTGNHTDLNLFIYLIQFKLLTIT